MTSTDPTPLEETLDAALPALTDDPVRDDAGRTYLGARYLPPGAQGHPFYVGVSVAFRGGWVAAMRAAEQRNRDGLAIMATLTDRLEAVARLAEEWDTDGDARLAEHRIAKQTAARELRAALAGDR